jgi:hypothetical protein
MRRGRFELSKDEEISGFAAERIPMKPFERDAGGNGFEKSVTVKTGMDDESGRSPCSENPLASKSIATQTNVKILPNMFVSSSILVSC